jgi:hypothetical protein
MFTQNEPDEAIRGQLRDDVPGKKPTNGGSSDTDTNEPIVIPTG